MRTHPLADLSHSLDWKAVIERAYRKTCYYLFLEEDRNLTAIAPLVHLKWPLVAGRLVSMPYLDGGGVLSLSSSAHEALKGAALELAVELGAGGVDLRGGERPADAEASEAGRFRFLVEIPASPSQLWKTVGSKVRNQVRKAKKSGLTTRRVSFEHLGEFYSILGRNMRDLGSPVHSLRFFSEIGRGFGERASLYLTYDSSSVPIAGAISLRFREQVTVPWASALREHRRFCPNHSLYWTILEECTGAGVESFDFGRSSFGSGTFQFKKQWGTEPVPLHWASLSRSGRREPEQVLDPAKHEFAAGLWRRLPLPVANRLGPMIRGYLPN